MKTHRLFWIASHCTHHLIRNCLLRQSFWHFSSPFLDFIFGFTLSCRPEVQFICICLGWETNGIAITLRNIIETLLKIMQPLVTKNRQNTAHGHIRIWFKILKFSADVMWLKACDSEIECSQNVYGYSNFYYTLNGKNKVFKCPDPHSPLMIPLDVTAVFFTK